MTRSFNILYMFRQMFDPKVISGGTYNIIILVMVKTK